MTFVVVVVLMDVEDSELHPILFVNYCHSITDSFQYVCYSINRQLNKLY
jgi:hypothetical protein